MRTRDLLFSGLSPFRRQKLRSTLTVLGVTIGIATLVASVAVGVGVRRIIEDGFKKERRLRVISVYPGFDRSEKDEFVGVPSEALRVEGDMSEARRLRIRRRLAGEWHNLHARAVAQPLTPRQIKEFSGWDHVVGVEPDLFETARLAYRGQTVQGECSGFVGDTNKLQQLVEFGRVPVAGTNEVMVHEFLLYRWGIRSDADVEAALGKSIRYEFAGQEAPARSVTDSVRRRSDALVRD